MSATRAALLGTESRKAFYELIDTLTQVDSRYLADEWGITQAADVADGHRFLMHLLEQALSQAFEADPERPVFKRSVTPTRKVLGDNPDAVYNHAPIRGDRRYRVRGNRAGAVYLSITVQGGRSGGHYASRVAAAINDDEVDIAADASFELILSPDRAPHRNWLQLPPDASSITVRHYFEEQHAVAADPGRQFPLAIEPLDNPGPPGTPSDASVAASLRRVISYIQGRSLLQPPPGKRPLPAWVSSEPNTIPKPQKPGAMAFAAVDCAYAMAPYLLKPDQALVMTGRFPPCRFANVVLWNRFLQSYDYAHRQVSLNRVQTVLEPDGSYRIVVAHRNPGVPNWLDTEGRQAGTLYWRFLLPEEEVEKPHAEVVPFDRVAKG
jgi:hypothetical protein